MRKNKIYLTLTILFLVGMLAMLMVLVMNLNDIFSAVQARHMPDSDTTIKIVGFILLLIGFMVFKQFYINTRHDAEFDENGFSRKYNTDNFNNLSKEDREALMRQQMFQQARLLDAETLKQITHKGSVDPDGDFDKLIGLSEVKRTLKRLAARMKFEREDPANKKKPLSEVVGSLHMCFYGPPGTGKTTCARIMTGYLYKYGYIKKNQCIEVDGNFFRGEAPGETSQKTKLLLTRARGGVLFIDEAYAMMGIADGQEAIATIIKEMEDNYDKLVLVLAGYEEEMKALINANPGFESRIAYYLHFPNYSIDELCEILQMMLVQKHMTIAPDALELFKQYMAQESKNYNFGNARTVRKSLDAFINTHALNLMDGKIDRSNRNQIMKIDLMPTEP